MLDPELGFTEFDEVHTIAENNFDVPQVTN